MTQGLLLQPITRVVWAGENLSAYDIGDGVLECLAQNVTVKLEKASAAPTCTFEISATPQGFELFQRLKTESLTEPWTVEYTYPGSETVAKFAFRYSGMSLTTGHDPKLRVTGVSVIKGCWTDNKISYTMEAGISLESFPQFLKEKAGECASDLKFVWVGQAKEVASKLIHKGNQNQRTPHVILTDVLRQSGFDVQIGDTSIDGTLVISYSPNYNKELGVDQPEEAKGEAKPGVRNFHVISLGLMSNITRKQEFNTGTTPTNRASSPTAPVANTVDAIGVVEPDSVPQESAAEQEMRAGTLGESNPSSSATSMEKGDPKAGEKRAALAELMTTTCNFTVPMLPKNVLMRPRDIAVVPSLSGPAAYLEDWEIQSVTYKMDNVGGVSIAVTGERPFTGKESMIAGTPVEEKIKAICAELTSPESWMSYFWEQPLPKQMALAG